MRFLIILLTLVALAGCKTIEVRVLESEKLVLLEPEAVYLNDCEAKAPPTVDEYMAMGMDGREDALSQTLAMQYKYKKDCTLDKRSLRELIVKQKQVLDTHNAKEAARIQALKTEIEKKNKPW